MSASVETFEPLDIYEIDPFRPLYKICKDELDCVIAKHEEWVISNGNAGERADLSNTDLSDANLEGANLQQAIFAGAKLNRANLRRTNLKWAVFYYANLNETDVSEADCYMAVFTKAKVRYLIRQNTRFEFCGIKSIEQIKLEHFLKSTNDIYNEPVEHLGVKSLSEDDVKNIKELLKNKTRSADRGWAYRTYV